MKHIGFTGGEQAFPLRISKTKRNTHKVRASRLQNSRHHRKNNCFATTGNDVDATQKGDVSSAIGLFDDGTAINQFPGAGLTQFNLAGTPLVESKPIAPVPNANGFNTLPAFTNIIKVTLQ